MKIERNAIRCNYCGHVLESRHCHDFRVHRCHSAGLVSTEYDHEQGKVVPAVPYIAVDGGHHYLRRLGHPQDYTDISVMVPDPGEEGA